MKAEINGYRETEKIDQMLNELLQSHPPTRANAMQWLNLIRDVELGLQTIRLAVLGEVTKADD